MILVLRVHPSREPDLILPDNPIFDPRVELGEYRDGFGNRCGRILAPAGNLIPRFDRSGTVDLMAVVASLTRKRVRPTETTGTA